MSDSVRKVRMVLFCTGSAKAEGAEGLRFTTAVNGSEATAKFGSPARIPSGRELRAFCAELKRSKVSIPKIAETYGVTRQTVALWVARATLGPVKVRGEKKAKRSTRRATGLVSRIPEDVIAAAPGKTWAELAEHFGVKRGTLQAYARRRGIFDALRGVLVAGKPGRKKGVKMGKLKKVEVETIVTMLRDGMEPKKVAETLGVREGVVMFWLDRSGVAAGKS